MHLHFVSYLRFCPTGEDQIHNGATLHVTYPTLSIPWLLMPWRFEEPGGCFTNVSRALQNNLAKIHNARNLAKIHNARNHIYGENFKLKLCTCAQSMALGTHTKFQLGILIRRTISATQKFRENILESLRNVSETPPRASEGMVLVT